jgi:hypothetical protein
MRYNTTMITVTCHTCGTEFQKPMAWAKRVSQHFCSRSCGGKERAKALRHHAHKANAARTPEGMASWRRSMTGANNPAWKGGATYFRKHGNYKPIKYVRCPADLMPMARADGYVMEHRLVVARMAGYCLTRTEVVHHVDHDPQNNAGDNLELWPDNRSHKAFEHGRIVPGAACRWSPRDSAPRSSRRGNQSSSLASPSPVPSSTTT